ncbi:MAG: glutathione S-transferase family protein [Rhodospirillaceae bacterium]|jgi:GSH-dependent disulfide-bond oxidoreductase|nr:glutathione S-transferase family protein [Rhodospirillaceae bacterium]
MIILYSKATSNGRKASIMLEESGLEYTVQPMALEKKEQKEDWYLKINPNGRVPCIVDDDGPGGETVSVFESGAILQYLAEKSDKFLPKDGAGRVEVLNWLYFAAGHITHTGLCVHWQVRNRDSGEEHAHLDMWQEENNRVYGVLDRGLEGRDYLAGEISIADFAAYPWIYRYDMQEIDLDRYPNVRDWLKRVGERPAVMRGLQIPPRDDDF